MHGVHKQTDKQGQIDRQGEEGGEIVGGGEYIYCTVPQEKKSRERQCALSCPNENKQLSDPLQTLKRRKHKTFTNNFVF